VHHNKGNCCLGVGILLYALGGLSYSGCDLSHQPRPLHDGFMYSGRGRSQIISTMHNMHDVIASEHHTKIWGKGVCFVLICPTVLSSYTNDPIFAKFLMRLWPDPRSATGGQIRRRSRSRRSKVKYKKMARSSPNFAHIYVVGPGGHSHHFRSDSERLRSLGSNVNVSQFKGKIHKFKYSYSQEGLLLPIHSSV
jgi:hypothetical protein